MIGAHQRAVSLTDISLEVRLTISTTHRILRGLEARDSSTRPADGRLLGRVRASCGSRRRRLPKPPTATSRCWPCPACNACASRRKETVGFHVVNGLRRMCLAELAQPRADPNGIGCRCQLRARRRRVGQGDPRRPARRDRRAGRCPPRSSRPPRIGTDGGGGAEGARRDPARRVRDEFRRDGPRRVGDRAPHHRRAWLRPGVAQHHPAPRPVGRRPKMSAPSTTPARSPSGSRSDLAAPEPPVPTWTTRRLLDRTRPGTIRLQRCDACREVRFPPMATCPYCGERGAAEIEHRRRSRLRLLDTSTSSTRSTRVSPTRCRTPSASSNGRKVPASQPDRGEHRLRHRGQGRGSYTTPNGPSCASSPAPDRPPRQLGV